MKRFLRVAIIGPPNAGKSTLLNRIVGDEVSCRSIKVHTTRSNIIGVYTEDNAQLEFVDSPGVVSKHSVRKHHLEETFLTGPKRAVTKCDLVAVVVDGSNPRDQRRINKGVVQMLNEHKDKKSVLMINKIDLIKDKAQLLDISTRLSQGCIEGRSSLSQEQLKKMPKKTLLDLNLMPRPSEGVKIKSKYIQELEPEREGLHNSIDETSFRYFSRIFCISALLDDGVQDVRQYLIDESKPVESWPHGPDYLTNLSKKDIVTQIIRGRVLDHVPEAVPYLVKYDYQHFQEDDYGSLIIHGRLKCPERYMVGKILGSQGVRITRIIDESRAAIARLFGCDVKLSLEVKEISPT